MPCRDQCRLVERCRHNAVHTLRLGQLTSQCHGLVCCLAASRRAPGRPASRRRDHRSQQQTRHDTRPLNRPSQPPLRHFHHLRGPLHQPDRAAHDLRMADHDGSVLARAATRRATRAIVSGPTPVGSPIVMASSRFIAAILGRATRAGKVRNRRDHLTVIRIGCGKCDLAQRDRREFGPCRAREDRSSYDDASDPIARWEDPS